VRRLKELAAEDAADEQTLLRIAVDGGGCSGFQYKISLDPQKEAGPNQPHCLLIVYWCTRLRRSDGAGLNLNARSSSTSVPDSGIWPDKLIFGCPSIQPQTLTG
jgi:hypothetical protein